MSSDLLSEVRYAEFVETGTVIEEVDFETLLRRKDLFLHVVT